MKTGNQAPVILDVSADAVGDGHELPVNGQGVSIQVDITGTATVTLRGSNDNKNFVDLASTSASAGYGLTEPWKHIQAEASGITTGTAKVTLGY